MSSPAAARRDRYGRRFYPVPHPETKEIFDLPGWTRVKKLLHSEPLEIWKLKTVARTIARRADLQMLAADEAQTYSAAKQALDANQNKANVGTAVHRYTEYIDADALDWDIVPPIMRPWLQHYIDAKARYGWSMVETEVSVYNIGVGYAGTADRFADIPGLGVVAFDLKTGENIWAETALQLSAYANAEGIWVPPADTDLPSYAAKLAELERDIAAKENFKNWGAPKSRKWSEHAIEVAHHHIGEMYWEEYAQWPGHRPMPEGLRTDIGVVVHLTAEGCELVPLKLDGDPSAFDSVKALCTQFKWQLREKDIVGQPLEVAGSSPADVSAASSAVTVDGQGSDQPQVHTDESPAAEELRRTYEGEPAPKKSRSKKSEESKPSFQEPEPTADWLVSRILALPEVPRVELANSWPEGIPTFKASRDHTPEQLQEVDRVLARIEANHELPFIDRPTVATPADEPTQSTASTHTDELVTADEREKIVSLIGLLDQDAIERVTARKNEAGIPNVKSPNLTLVQALNLLAIITDELQHNIQGEAEAA